MTEKLDALESLLFDWESGVLDEQGAEALREVLRNDPGAGARFVQSQLMTAAMQIEADSGLAPSLSGDAAPVAVHASRVTQPARRVRRTTFWLASVASLLAGLVAGWFVFTQFPGETDRSNQLTQAGVAGSRVTGAGDPNQRDASQEATSHGIVLVTRLVDTEWEAGQSAIEVGDALPPGRFAIRAGHAQLEFFCGATVVVEGPAELLLESATLARVRSGRLRAHVPPAARGFALEVDDMKVVDLGTEFAVSFSAQGANVQVFDGEVELHRRTDEMRLLSAGQAVIRTDEGALQDSQLTPERFVDIAGLESRAQTQRAVRYQRWKEWSDDVRRDPRLIAYFAFDQTGDWERQLACSITPPNRDLDGAIVGAREVEGRWDEKRALIFKRPADRVRVQIPGEYRSLTLACWAKIDSLDRWYNSLFLTDGYDKGEPHWQILDTGQIYFSVRPVERAEEGPRDFKALSPSFWQPSMNGQWLHLAVTFDMDAKTITHYTNGKVLSRHLVPDAQLPSTTRIGAASIGNWATPTMPDAGFAIRNLNGSIDELAIFAAALTADEIKEMFEHGKP